MSKLLEFQLLHQSFQWVFRTDFFKMDWLDLHAVQGTVKSLLQHHSSKASILWCTAFFIAQLSHPYITAGKTIPLIIWTFVSKIKEKKVKKKFGHLCLTLWDLVGYTVHGVLQASIVQWVAFPFSRAYSQLWDQTQSPTLQADSLQAETLGKPKNTGACSLSLL